MYHAELIRKLRIERGLSQESLSKGISSRTTLASFEQRKTNISFSLVVNYLEKMNISLEEYNYLYMKKCAHDKRKMSEILSNGSMDIQQRQELTKLLKNRYEKSNDRFFDLLAAQNHLLSLFMMKNMDDIEKSDAYKKISSHLERVETWGRFELVMFSNCLFLFSDEYISIMFETCVKRMSFYQEHMYFSKDFIAFLINGAQLSLSRGAISNLSIFIQEMKRVTEQFDDKNLFIIYKIMVNILSLIEQPDNKEHKTRFKRNYEILEWLDMSSWKDYFIEQLLNYGIQIDV
ncbi:helix-turn-helix domain-containing protein [Enterococcus faecalis]|uniref:Rgg/GadR/MutR family transcriptional regulator n=1 Tax=Enterococcus faecalis TaxID=1351 RepID=UPI002091DF03|nr:Rgg/GadR/MutR family transcriptional regulator [Enterococcus faecalis]MCO5432261.1 helix-turn-helix domain-containing protein [Enterococcus faecalis]